MTKGRNEQGPRTNTSTEERQTRERQDREQARERQDREQARERQLGSDRDSYVVDHQEALRQYFVAIRTKLTSLGEHTGVFIHDLKEPQTLGKGAVRDLIYRIRQDAGQQVDEVINLYTNLFRAYLGTEMQRRLPDEDEISLGLGQLMNEERGPDDDIQENERVFNAFCDTIANVLEWLS